MNTLNNSNPRCLRHAHAEVFQSAGNSVGRMGRRGMQARKTNGTSVGSPTFASAKYPCTRKPLDQRRLLLADFNLYLSNATLNNSRVPLNKTWNQTRAKGGQEYLPGRGRTGSGMVKGYLPTSPGLSPVFENSFPPRRRSKSLVKFLCKTDISSRSRTRDDLRDIEGQHLLPVPSYDRAAGASLPATPIQTKRPKYFNISPGPKMHLRVPLKKTYFKYHPSPTTRKVYNVPKAYFFGYIRYYYKRLISFDQLRVAAFTE